MRLKLTATALALALTTSTALAATCGTSSQGFKAYMAAVKKDAAAQGISGEVLANLDGLQYDAAIIKHDRAQNVFAQSFLQFSGRMASDYRVKRGRELIVKYKDIFDAVQQKYGVPAPVITAFWALETDFGADIGKSPTLQALVTLGWDCRRPEKFRPQIVPALLLIQNGDLAPEEMRGAWAGEIGQTQFMAYDYNDSAVDFDGDGRRNLRNSIPDVIASTANLLKKHGWQAGQPWLQEVQVPADLPWEQADLAIQLPRAQWAKWGVKYVGGKALKADKTPSTLLLPMGRNGPAFLAYNNFSKSYLKWNESLIYSTTAAYLATRIGGAGKLNTGRETVTPLDFKQIVALQDILTGLGYDVGKSDGKIGAGTRAAVKAEQIKAGMPADSYPDADLLDRLSSN